MAELVTYTQTEIDLAKTLMSRRHIDESHGDFFSSKHIGYVLSKVAEWKVAERLGIDLDLRPEDFRTPDLRVNGVLIGVRLRDRLGADLMHPVGKLCSAAWQVLVEPAGEGKLLIVGAASRDQILTAPIDDFGFGPTRVVTHASLTPWESFRDSLLGVTA